MRTLTGIILTVFLLAVGNYSEAQPLSSADKVGGANFSVQGFMMSQLKDAVEIKDKRYILKYEQMSVINGRKVFGTPFLYDDWQAGVLTTPDGRAYNGYKLKYDAYNQGVHFSDGKDSLEVNELIKDFTLVTTQADSIVKIRFISAQYLENADNPLFYEVMHDNDNGYLLKVNRKVIKDAASMGLPNPEDKRVFDLDLSYYYFDKKTRKVIKLKQDAAELAQILKLDDETKEAVRREVFDLQKEADMKRMMKFIDDRKRKGF